MLETMNPELAVVFAHYAEHRDARIAFLARKAETKTLSDAELTEFVLRVERAQERFLAERAALLG